MMAYRYIEKKSKADGVASILYPVLFGAIVFVLWQTGILHMLLHTDEFTLPLPSRILSIIGENAPKIQENAKATLTATCGGLFLGSVLGYGIAILASVFPKWGAGGLSLIAACNAIPIVAIAPVLTNWTKDFSKVAATRSMIAKILVVMIVCMVAMSLSAYRGLTEVKPFSEDLMKTCAAGRFTTFIKLRVPNSTPFVFTALRICVPASVISAIVSEYFAEYITGVGRMIRENIVLAQYSTAWAYITVACLIGIALYLILMVCEAVLLKNRR